MHFLKQVLIIVIAICSGYLLVQFRKTYFTDYTNTQNSNSALSIAEKVKSILLRYPPPVRVEVEIQTKKFFKNIDEIKKIKLPLNADSSHYLRLEIFSDDSDLKSPLIVQIKSIDLKTNNLLNEESTSYEVLSDK